MSAPTVNTNTNTQLDTLSINAIRCLSMDAIQQANSGHPGLPLGAAPMAYVLWTRFLKHNPANPQWFDRDRFILSAGHGSMLLYSLLHLTGYDLTIEDLKQFRQWESKTPGHPERDFTPGVEVTTGPLGQGFANGVGMAIAEAYLAAKFNRPGHEIVNHYTYALVSDGDLMEGVVAEAASLAGHLKLGKLIYLYDDNQISLASTTNLTFTEDVAKRFEAYGWHTVTVNDGNDLAAIDAAIEASQKETERPSLIIVRTQIGFGSPNKQGSFEAHGAPLGADEVRLTRSNLGWPSESPFEVPEEVTKHTRQSLETGRLAESDWNQRFEAYSQAHPELAQALRRVMQNELPSGWDSEIPVFPADAKGLATRAASGKVLNAFAGKLPQLLGGSADLNPSTQTALKGLGDFEHPSTKTGVVQGAVGDDWSYAGQNIAYGVREHAMGSLNNGMVAHGGVIPFSATFLTFADYMRPAIRLAALMELQSIYVFTHDSFAVGEDGPTHQPIEHVAALRAIPQLQVIRPADANETAVAWKVAIESRKRPTALILTRQNVPTLDRSRYASAEGVRQGAYVLSEASQGQPKLILIATGSEVSLAVEAQGKLEADGIPTRVVSMPSWELFDAQPEAYRESVLPTAVTARLAIEAGLAMGWHRFVGPQGDILSIEHYGASAPAGVLMQKFGFTVDNVVARAKAVLAR